MLRRNSRRTFVALTMALAGLTAGAAPKPPQCWDCVRRLAMELPAVNADGDQSYEEGLTIVSQSVV
jgi:hypothetical protein